MTASRVLTAAAKRRTSPPQSKPLRADQVKNTAGGYVWEVDTFQALRRFLILGSAGGTYYISEEKLTEKGLSFIEAALKEDGSRTILEIIEISESGRAPKNDYAIFALAVAVAKGDENTKSLALSALPRVARIGTHLFQFVSYLEAFGTLTGRAKRRALGQWYASKDAEKLAYEVIKYRQRDGWSHRDILRLAHPARKVSSGNPTVDIDDDQAVVLDWVTRGWFDFDEQILNDKWNTDYFLAKIEGFERIQRAETAADAAKLITAYSLPREAVPTQFLKSTEVWDALLNAGSGMPLGAMIRNLAVMTRNGLLTQTSEATKTVVAALKSEEAVRKARIHPMNVLFALKTYGSGGGFRSRAEPFKPVGKILDALDGVFYTAFGNVEPTGKRILFGLDVSGSMGSPIGDTNVSMREAAAAMALVTMNVEDDYGVIGFTAGSPTYGRRKGGGYGHYEGGVEELSISPRQRLDDVASYMASLRFGATDCALPMLYASAKGLEFDAFIVITDNETWFGDVHPAKALENYRAEFVPDARQVVIGMAGHEFSIADPTDPLTLDVVGFDTATPQIISEFISGLI